MEKIILPLFGGVLIGLSSSIILYFLGRITGISGIFASAITSIDFKENAWKWAFIAGLIITGIILTYTNPNYFQYTIDKSYLTVISAGLIVGFGTRLGSGCTSGHGVCGIPRLSARSILATLTFMLIGIITVAIQRFFL